MNKEILAGISTVFAVRIIIFFNCDDTRKYFKHNLNFFKSSVSDMGRMKCIQLFTVISVISDT